MNSLKKPRVLVVCTGNACRSQMAEAIWRHETAGKQEVFSAGTHPWAVHPLARQAVEELGIDMSGQFSKSVHSLVQVAFDLVITLCDHAVGACPSFPQARRHLYWPFDDPILAKGTVQQRLDAFRWTRDQIRHKIRQFLAASPVIPNELTTGYHTWESRELMDRL